MFATQPLEPWSADEELGTIRVLLSAYYGQDARTRMVQDKVLTLKSLPEFGPAAGAIMANEVTTLARES